MGATFTLKKLTLLNWLLFLCLLSLFCVPAYLIVRVDKREITHDIIEASRKLPVTATAREAKIESSGFAQAALPLPQLLKAVDSFCETVDADPPLLDPTSALKAQSLCQLHLLLAAYEQTGETKYLGVARDRIVAWITWSNSSVIGKDFTWHDHAISERVAVFARFWLNYRNSPLYDEKTAKLFLEAVSIHAGFLSDPRLFTYQNNHGLMQNIALLQLATFFPAVVKQEAMVLLAIDRLNDQLSILVSPSGMMLEHSPGYHGFVTKVLEHAIEYLSQLGYKVPAQWYTTLAKMKEMDRLLLRPDGSYPPVGDTGITGASPVAHGENVDDEARVLPYAGFGIFWRDQSQLVTTWQNFPGHAHKHADELSVYLYSRGTNWLGGPGYWGFGDAVGRGYATDWTGANAPSYEGENSSARRSCQLVGKGHSDHCDFLELARIGPSGFLARRQLVWIDGSVLLVLDNISSPGNKGIVDRWHSSAGLSVCASGKSCWILSDTASGRTAKVAVAGEEGLTASFINGAKRPMQGWSFVDGKPQPAPVLVLKHPGPEAHLATALWAEAGKTSAPLVLNVQPGKSNQRWAAHLTLGNDRLLVEREGASLTVTSSAVAYPPKENLQIVAGEEVGNLRTRHDRLWAKLDLKYHANPLCKTKNGMNISRFKKKVAFLAALFVVQEAIAAVLFCRRRAKMLRAWRGVFSAALACTIIVVIMKNFLLL